MNKSWSELFKKYKTQIKKKDSFDDGIASLLKLRKSMFDAVIKTKESFPIEGYSKQPYKTHSGYESKTMAYSLYHIARIEDIVVHSYIQKNEQIFSKNGFIKNHKFPLTTTGNELHDDEIRLFSEKLDIDLLHSYFKEVYQTTNKFLKELKFIDLKNKPANLDAQVAVSNGWVSNDPTAIWLIDYWNSKKVLGFLNMPLSRHWIMHIEAFLRIKDKIRK